MKSDLKTTLICRHIDIKGNHTSVTINIFRGSRTILNMTSPFTRNSFLLLIVKSQMVLEEYVVQGRSNSGKTGGLILGAGLLSIRLDIVQAGPFLSE